MSKAFELYPAIDLRDEKVVRLRKGDFADETVYGSEPIAVARSFAAAGAPWVHTVDLDAARTGDAHNRHIVRAIAQTVEVPVQSGGGVRDRATAEALLATGVRRIVLGTVAVEKPSLVIELAEAHPGRIAVGLDARNGFVAARGWIEGSTLSVADLVRRYSDRGVSAFVVTDIDRDGMLQGPDTDGLARLLDLTEVDVVASGGVSSLDDLRTLMHAAGETTGRKLAGAIVGVALYEGRFTVDEAVQITREVGAS